MGKLKESLKRLQQTLEGEEKTKTKSNGTEKVIKAKGPVVKVLPVKQEASKIKAKESILLDERTTLSKKEKRKLKKIQKEEVEEENEEDSDILDDSWVEIEAEDVEDEDEDVDQEEEEEEEDEDEEEQAISFDTNALEDSSSDEEILANDKESDEEQEDVPLSDVELDDDADVIPYQKITVNNRPALRQALSSISLSVSKLPFYEHFSLTSQEDVEIKDIYDDLERELVFYKQGLAASKTARKILLKEQIPFSRPQDYFAEMVKSDEHMDRLKQKLIEEETSKKASQEAKKQRELKKFGKQVQHAKLQERQKDKRETLDKIKSLKRKRQTNEISTDDFDIAIEEAAAAKSDRKGPNAKRLAKNSKYGSGGKKRFSKSTDAESSADMSGYSSKRMKSGPKPGSKSGFKARRPGKSKRAH